MQVLLQFLELLTRQVSLCPGVGTIDKDIPYAALYNQELGGPKWSQWGIEVNMDCPIGWARYDWWFRNPKQPPGDGAKTL